MDQKVPKDLHKSTFVAVDANWILRKGRKGWAKVWQEIIKNKNNIKTPVAPKAPPCSSYDAGRVAPYILYSIK